MAISLAVKYRPKKWEEVVEQKYAKQILQYQADHNQLRHAYLFCGSAGTGKTSLSRLFADYINQGKGNVIEVDAASNNGIDQIRALIAEAEEKPIDCNYKVIILDEVHSLSSSAFQCLLKTLEEPPATSIFILCTTDPQKIPATILSRVQRYEFSKISLDGIYNRLKFIMQEEIKQHPEYKYHEDALMYIAKLAEGGMRNAITMLDKCLSLNPEISIDSVVNTLGTVDYKVFFSLLMYIGSCSYESALSIIDTVYNQGKDIKNFMKKFEYFLVDVCKYKLSNSFEYVNIPNLPEYKQSLEDEDLEITRSVLKWCNQVNYECKYEPNAKALLECKILMYGVEE